MSSEFDGDVFNVFFGKCLSEKCIALLGNYIVLLFSDIKETQKWKIFKFLTFLFFTHESFW